MAARTPQNSAVSVKFLVEFASQQAPHLDTLDIVQHAIIPQTAGRRCRYADILKDDQVGPPTFFISHRWAYNFKILVNSIKRFLRISDQDHHALSDVFVWIDIFAINQHPGSQQQDDLATIKSVAAQAQRTLLVLDTRGLALTRIWVLYEMWVTLMVRGAEGLIILSYDVDLLGLQDIFVRLDISEAQAAVDSDRQRILSDIEMTTGITDLNLQLKKALVDSTRHEAQSARQLRHSNPKAFCTTLNKASQMMTLAGLFIEAEPLLREVLEVLSSESSGVHQAGIASCLNNLAEVLRQQNKFEEAEPLYRQALSISEEASGPVHPATATYLANIAGLLHSQNRTDEAGPLYRRAFKINMETLGPEHPNTVFLSSWHPSLLSVQGSLEEAEAMQRSALEVLERKVGRQHISTGWCLANLAALLMDQGKMEEAEPLFRETLAITLKVLGAQHVDTATCQNNLGEVLVHLNKLEEAEPILLAALATRRVALGNSHPGTATTLNNISSLYLAMGRHDEARELLVEALEILKVAFGPEHLTTLTQMNNLAVLMQERGDMEAAEPMLRKVLSVREASLGESHPSTLMSIRNMAGLLHTRGANDEALSYARRGAAIAEQLYGLDHEDSTPFLNLLAVTEAAVERSEYASDDDEEEEGEESAYWSAWEKGEDEEVVATGRFSRPTRPQPVKIDDSPGEASTSGPKEARPPVGVSPRAARLIARVTIKEGTNVSGSSSRNPAPPRTYRTLKSLPRSQGLLSVAVGSRGAAADKDRDKDVKCKWPSSPGGSQAEVPSLDRLPLLKDASGSRSMKERRASAAGVVPSDAVSLQEARRYRSSQSCSGNKSFRHGTLEVIEEPSDHFLPALPSSPLSGRRPQCQQPPLTKSSPTKSSLKSRSTLDLKQVFSSMWPAAASVLPTVRQLVKTNSCPSEVEPDPNATPPLPSAASYGREAHPPSLPPNSAAAPRRVSRVSMA